MGKMTQQYRPAAIIITVFLLSVALVLAARSDLFPFTLWFQHIPRTPVNVTAVPIGTINKPIRIDRPGFIENSTSIPLHTEFSGRVSEIYVTEGQAVKAGQPLLKLQGSSGPSGDSGPSTATGENQKAGVSQQVQDNYDNALKDVKRYQKLYEQGAIPRRQLEDAMVRLQQAQASLNNGQNAMSSTNTNAITTTLMVPPR
ncbi:efflux RND transporter periplasmic adaptor subunit [Thermosinus carboxydivorans]|nr:biotin/lipoyl-binding protein [Thermosinus carboxydivorans]